MRPHYGVLALVVFVTSIKNEDNRKALLEDAAIKLKHSLQQQMGLVKEIKMNYKFIKAEGYHIGILMDPCRQHAANCCVDSFGDSAYLSSTAISEKTMSLLDEAGNSIDVSISRVSDRATIFDPDCYVDDDGLTPYRLIKKHILGKGLVVRRSYDNDSLCIGRLAALTPVEGVQFPPCWDWNASVDARKPCRFVDGRVKQHCIAVGYTQTAHIPQCFGAFALRNDCGTFLELHLADDELVLSQTRLLSEYTSGFRTTTIPLHHRGNPYRIVCNGSYEIWWVLRRKNNAIVYKKKPFLIISPVCDFNRISNEYEKYHTLVSVSV
uniref:Uncharacterized protein AlNc14C33G3036 n=1 Tax=Albugo laibachii Nc14 TaxID=890382 RepID=F0W876_9STRA|nr:conserved hypothetical protein [Albugo laibachii Nc14]|eukprot:CCA17360.1 conserved hypothetical protein [Albugo laibachii Nc14]